MAALFDALFRGLRGENGPAVKQVKETDLAADTLLPNDGVVNQLELSDSDQENLPDITGLSFDPKDELPIVTSPIRSGETNSSFDTTSTLEDTIVSTPGVDVSFGPQGTPYVIRRRPPLREIDVGGTPSRAPHNTPESNAYIAPPRRTAAISIRHPDGSLDEVEHVVDLAQPATAWRQEQVNGVDAIIIDEAVPSAAKHDIRTTTMGLRTHLDLTKPAQGVHKPASEVHTTAPKPTALPSRPLIIRSAEDILLLRKVPSIDVKDLRTALTGAELKPAAPNFVPDGVSPTPASLPASMILKSQGKAARSRESKAEKAVPAADPFDGLFDQALVNAAKQGDSTTQRLAAEDSFTPSYADLKAIWAAATEHYSRKISAASEPPLSDVTENASFESTASKNLTFPPGTYSTPVRIPSATAVSSKADQSANWRHKGMEVTTPGGREIPAIAVTSPPAVEGNSSTMTIDSLFQKFNNHEEKSLEGPKSVDPAIKETSDTPMKPTKTIKPAQSSRRPLSEAKPSILNSAMKKTPSVGTKGAVHAGKPLKKKVEINESPDMSGKAKGKQKAE